GPRPPRRRPRRPGRLPAVVLPALRRRPDRPPPRRRLGPLERPPPHQILPRPPPPGGRPPGPRPQDPADHRAPRHHHRTLAATVRRGGLRSFGGKGGPLHRRA